MIAILTILLSYGKEGFLAFGECPLLPVQNTVLANHSYYSIPQGDHYTTEVVGQSAVRFVSDEGYSFGCNSGLCPCTNCKHVDRVVEFSDDLVVLSNCVSGIDVIVDQITDLTKEQQIPTNILRPMLRQFLESLPLPTDFHVQRFKVLSKFRNLSKSQLAFVCEPVEQAGEESMTLVMRLVNVLVCRQLFGQ